MAAPSLLEFHAATALLEFETAMRDPQHLMEIHQDLNPGPGRRVREIALNRACVVLSVAAWQAFVQDLAKAVLVDLEPPPGDPSRPQYRILKAMVMSATQRFSTPNSENTRELLMTVGFDPWPHWTWRLGPTTLSPTEVRDRLNAWLRVRHSVAHGDDQLPDEDVLTATTGGRTIRRINALRCMRFFRDLASTTERGIRAVLLAP
jgi:hypothetical protein